MPYIISATGVEVNGVIGTYPAYATQAVTAVTTDTTNKLITVTGWPIDPQTTVSFLDVDAYIFTPGNEVTRVNGISFTETSPGIYTLVIGVDQAPTGSSANLNYVPLMNAVQNWDVKVENIGNANIVVNDLIPIVAGHSSVWGKAKQVRPIKIDATNSVAVASNAIF